MPLLVLAFSLFFAMVAMDLLSNRWSINPQHLPPAHTINTLTAWATITEESLKLLSEATFLVAFVSMLRMTRPHRRQMAASLGACAAEAHESRA